MNQQFLAFLVVLFTASAPCIILGYLIAFRGKYHFIAGWDAAKFNHPSAVGNIIGKVVMFLGIYVLVVTAAWWKMNLSDVAFTLWLIPSAIFPIAAIIYCKVKYGKPKT